MTLAPITLFVYNRPYHTRRTIEALKKNMLASQSNLIIYSDGPKHDVVSKEIEEVRSIIKGITGFKSIRIVERKHNLGLAKSVISGITETINQYGKAIVLEDDLETTPYFLKYMNDGLNLYENDPEVASIHGYVYPIQGLDKSFFIKGADCWGWATWKRAWDLFEEDGQKLFDELKQNKLLFEFDFYGTFPYSRMLKEQIEGKNSSWAVRWYASMFLQQMLTLYTSKSFVRNIGNDDSGSHSVSDDSYEPFLISDFKGLDKISIVENERCKKLFSLFFTSITPGLLGKIKLSVKKYLK